MGVTLLVMGIRRVVCMGRGMWSLGGVLEYTCCRENGVDMRLFLMFSIVGVKNL